MIERCYFCGIEFDMQGEEYARYYQGVPVCGCCCEDYSMEMDAGLSPEMIKEK